MWIPVISVWQVTADVDSSTGVPEGHGHSHRADHVNGWADVARPPGWTAAHTDRLRPLVGGAEPVPDVRAGAPG
jgi:uncharacterized membrane protein